MDRRRVGHPRIVVAAAAIASVTMTGVLSIATVRTADTKLKALSTVDFGFVVLLISLSSLAGLNTD